ncbi:arylsulfatase [Yangia mangrovi]|uniref:Arylsulfatase n=1 Tax=Alloyangia mangrovi TaxID=1779329 RepID=A0A2A3K0L9_9RHOB|nr:MULTISPECIES: arylsulfatase [Roseobacteraceae]MCT4373433.1 arylsulfatase [Alloyangia mangrovi]
MHQRVLSLASVLALSAIPLAAQEVGNAFSLTVQTEPYLEPHIPRPEQEAEAAEKLAALAEKTGGKPNILLLLVDDMGWGDPGSYGGGIAVGAPTPEMDLLAREGLRLTSTYSQPTCTPSRAALLTGRIPTRSGLTRPTLSGENPTTNPWSIEATLPGLLSDAGYRTALSGKWHLGEAEGSRPHEAGFDEFYGILSVISDMSQQLDERLYPDLVLRPERLAALQELSEAAITKGLKGQPLEVAEEVTSIDQLGQIDQKFADFSEDFIRRAAADDVPFFLEHSFARVHNDSYPAEGYAGKSPAGFPYKDAILEVDDIVARLIGVLEETGELENTFVFLTSDNGANEDLAPDGGFQPWRGGKGTTWEGGVRVPGIAYWPGMIAPGRESDGLFDLTDFFNTSLALAGVSETIPSERFIDGIDQSSFLLADNGESRRDAVFMYSENNLMAIRWMEYKIHFKVMLQHAARRNLDETTVSDVGMSPWVYNLYTDPKEQASSGHSRFEWGLPQALQRVQRHLATFADYPSTDIGLGKP